MGEAWGDIEEALVGESPSSVIPQSMSEPLSESSPLPSVVVAAGAAAVELATASLVVLATVGNTAEGDNVGVEIVELVEPALPFPVKLASAPAA